MTVGGITSITNGANALQKAEFESIAQDFKSLVNEISDKSNVAKNKGVSGGQSTLSSSQISKRGKITGDVGMDFSGFYTRDADKTSEPLGAARNQNMRGTKTKSIDKTSELYEKCMALEGYFVKQMLSSMRNTVQKSGLTGGEDSRNKMYEDMLYDEYATSMTKNAGLGLADQMYLSLV